MKGGKARVELGGRLLQFMAAADETMRELRVPDKSFDRHLAPDFVPVSQ